MTSERFAPKDAFVWIWLPEATHPLVAGRIERVGNQYLFNYGRSYLGRKNAIPIFTPELPLQAGQIEPAGPLTIASALRDGAPDTWGRRVIINRLAGGAEFSADGFLDFDELTFMLQSGSDRIGALDFQISATDYVPREKANPTLDELQQSTEMVEDGVPLTPALANALEQGTAIGGARPKALINDQGRKYVAKFSSSCDEYNVVKGEFVAMRLAKLCGLNVASVSLTQALGKDVLLIERFDRTKAEAGWCRRAMVSALTRLSLDEIKAAHASYQDLAEIIRARFENARATLHEMFGRMVFNILVGNTDDHARNHAAFWNGECLALTPAYDICPQSRVGHEASQAMLLSGPERRSQLIHCLSAALHFHLSEEEALAMISQQIVCIKGQWNDVCDEAGLSQVDRNFFWRRQFLNPMAFEDIQNRLPAMAAVLD
ncbi:MAG: HipA domain-containing protein [Rhodobacteraceae bacterium]|nr:HipA domain-containing protein [Paracoccaceae bacterium]